MSQQELLGPPTLIRPNKFESNSELRKNILKLSRSLFLRSPLQEPSHKPMLTAFKFNDGTNVEILHRGDELRWGDREIFVRVDSSAWSYSSDWEYPDTGIIFHLPNAHRTHSLAYWGLRVHKQNSVRQLGVSLSPSELRRESDRVHIKGIGLYFNSGYQSVHGAGWNITYVTSDGKS